MRVKFEMNVVDVVVKVARFLHEQEEAKKKRAKVEQVNYVRKISSKICPFLSYCATFVRNYYKKVSLITCPKSVTCPKV